MAPVVITNLLFLCGALIVSAYAQDNMFEDCPLPNVTQGNNYTLTVNPTSYQANISYRVTVKGSIDSTTVLFQVIDSTNNYILSGWQNGTQACNGSRYQISANQTSLISNWNSPNSTSITCVTIRAYVRTADNVTSMRDITLAYVGSTGCPATTTNTTTAATITTGTIFMTSTAASTTTKTATTMTTTTTVINNITTNIINTTTDISTISSINSTTSTSTAATNASTSKMNNSAPTLLASCTILGIIQVMALAFLYHLTA